MNDTEQIREQIQALTKRLSVLETRPELKDHRHTGFDVSSVYWSDVRYKTFNVRHTIQGANAANAAFYGVFFIAPFACYVSKFQEVHQTAGTGAGTGYFSLEKLTGVEAPGTGVGIDGVFLSLKATANTVQTAVLSDTLADRTLAIGDRLALRPLAVVTGVANVTVDVEITKS